MIVSNKSMDVLKGIGLNLYERKLWVALLARGTSTAGELSGIAGVPRSRAYDVLQSLADKGFVVVQNAKPTRYVAIEPAQAIERAKKKVEEDMMQTVDRMEDLKSSPTMRELGEVFGKGMKVVSSEDLTGTIRGKGTIRQHMESMLKSAGRSISILTTAEGARELHEHHYSSLKGASDKGVKIRIAALPGERSQEAVKALLGVAEVRHMSEKDQSVSGKLCIVDGKETLVGLTDPKAVHETQHVGIWSRSEHASGRMFEPMFDMVWNGSKPAA